MPCTGSNIVFSVAQVRHAVGVKSAKVQSSIHKFLLFCWNWKQFILCEVHCGRLGNHQSQRNSRASRDRASVVKKNIIMFRNCTIITIFFLSAFVIYSMLEDFLDIIQNGFRIQQKQETSKITVNRRASVYNSCKNQVMIYVYVVIKTIKQT